MKGIARAHGRSQKQARPLTAEALAAVKATAESRRPLGDGKRQESAEKASWRGRVDLALLSVLRDGLLPVGGRSPHPGGRGVQGQRLGADCRAPVQDRPPSRGRGTLHRQRSRPGPAGPEYTGLQADHTPCRKRGQGRGLRRRLHRPQRPRGHGQDLAKNGVELPALMTASWWKSSKMPARYTERQAADRGAVARDYQDR